MSVLKKCKVVVLSTEKASTNFSMIMNTKNELRLPANPFKYNVEKYNKEGFDCYNLYIISDDEIKEGDWIYNDLIKKIFQADFDTVKHQETNECKKIIATTDSSLCVELPYGNKDFVLPQPSQSFIEKYITEYNKGNVITKIMVEYDVINEGYNQPEDVPYQECEILKVNSKDNTITIKKIKDSWSRDEVISLLYKHTEDMFKQKVTLDKWVEENL